MLQGSSKECGDPKQQKSGRIPSSTASGSSSWSPGDHYLWARKHEGSNANPSPRPGSGNGLLGDTPGLPLRPLLKRPTSATARPSSRAAAPPPVDRPTATLSSAPWLQRAGNLPWAGARGVVERREWSVWVDYRQKVSSGEMGLETAQKTDIEGIADFRGILAGLEMNGQGLSDGSDVAIFSRGVRPTWEASQAHGKWVLLCEKHDTMARLLLVLQAVLDGVHPNLRHVCGVVLSVRPTRDCIAIWNTKGGDSNFIKATRNALVSFARLLPSQKLNYFIIRAGPPPSKGHTIPRSETEGGMKSSRGRPAVGIHTDLEGTENLRNAMSRAKTGTTAASVSNSQNSSPGEGQEGVSWAPYGIASGSIEEHSSSGWRSNRGSSSDMTWPPPKRCTTSQFAGCPPLLSMDAYGSTFGGYSIWAPRGGEASAVGSSPDTCGSPGVARQIEALLLSSPSTQDKDESSQTSPSQSSTFFAESTSGIGTGSSGPSPAVGLNSRFFDSAQIPDVDADDDQEGDEADVSEGEGAMFPLSEAAGEAMPKEDKEEEEAAEEEELVESLREDIVEGKAMQASRDAVCAAVDAAMDWSGVKGLSRELRVKMAMRSVLAAEKLAEMGVVGKNGRHKDKRSDQSSTESEAHSRRRDAKTVSVSKDLSSTVTCAQRAVWVLCGAALTAGSALMYTWAASETVTPISII